MNFAGTRGDNESVLELTDIQNASALKDAPLEIELDVPLRDDEAVLPVVFDGQHAVLGGDVWKDDNGRTQISIDHLPVAPDQRRSLTGSLKMYFFKTYLKQSVNQLRWVEYQADGSFTCHKSMVANKVAAAKNILLLVHGITGDTENMAKGVRAIGLDGRFDLVLTYDYENLATPIPQTAQALKADLAAAGLQAGDDKSLTLLVHSMGGLVSRWFIEREGGNTVVDHLVMCGTPNNGSPLGRIEEARKILNVLASLAMTYLPALIPFQASALLLLNRSKKLTPTLEQMHPSSEFITTLNSSPDPGIRYTVLAGDVGDVQGADGRVLCQDVGEGGAERRLRCALRDESQRHRRRGRQHPRRWDWPLDRAGAEQCGVSPPELFHLGRGSAGARGCGMGVRAARAGRGVGRLVSRRCHACLTRLVSRS